MRKATLMMYGPVSLNQEDLTRLLRSLTAWWEAADGSPQGRTVPNTLRPFLHRNRRILITASDFHVD